MQIFNSVEEKIIIGQEVVLEGPAAEGHFATVFEDDGDTGYFYALDTQADGNSIQDALHIYDVEKVVDRGEPSVVKIGWSKDRQRAVLLINDFPHAVFDFRTRQGFCRTGFPTTRQEDTWSPGGHQWDDSVIDLFR